MPPEIRPDTVAGRTPGVLAEDVLGETVILDVESDRYTRLNRTGGVLWARLAEPATVRDLGRELAERFGIPEERALADASRLVAGLAERGLVTLS